MKRPSNSDGDEASRFPHAAGELPASSPRPAAGETVIKFPSPAAFAGASEDAGVSSASASSFVPLAVPVQAVVLRLQGKFPRVKAMRGADCWEEETPRPSVDHRGEERD